MAGDTALHCAGQMTLSINTHDGRIVDQIPFEAYLVLDIFALKTLLIYYII